MNSDKPTLALNALYLRYGFCLTKERSKTRLYTPPLLCLLSRKRERERERETKSKKKKKKEEEKEKKKEEGESLHHPHKSEFWFILKI